MQQLKKMNTSNLFNPAIPQDSYQKYVWGQLYGSSFSLAVINAYQQLNQLQVIVTPDSQSANRIEHELKFFANGQDINILAFPDWETLPYDLFSPHQDIISQRLLTLFRLPKLSKAILILPIFTLMQRLAPLDFLQQHSLVYNLGDNINLDLLRESLTAAGYRCVSEVMSHGEFAIRGSIIDLFPMGSVSPYRIDLFDNEIDSIRIFDPETQRSTEKITAINLLPAHEFAIDEPAITLFRRQWRENFSGDPRLSPIYEDISVGIISAGIEYYLPLFFEQCATLFDYLPQNSVIYCLENYQQKAESFWHEISERYEQRRHDVTRPILKPAQVFVPVNDVLQQLKQFARVDVTQDPKSTTTHSYTFNTEPPPSLQLNAKSEKPLQRVKDYLDEPNRRILFCAETTGRREVLLELLSKIQVRPTSCETWQAFLNSDEKIAITVAPLDFGANIVTPNISIIAESQLYAQQVLQRRLRKKRESDPNHVIRDLVELQIGTPVVHLEHGVGRYLGLRVMQINDAQTEFLLIEYAGNDKLYVPVSSLHLINRYSGADLDHAPLHRLGSDKWQKAKRKALMRAHDVAAELLEIYAKREARSGITFNVPDDNYHTFAAEFAFEETADQQQAIQAVIQDMVSTKSMDRLICGDVGFGKTEVALRAAFLAVQSHKQVAMLVPTTLLAQQHYQNFLDRFSQWPIQIEVISRFRSAKETELILKDLANHKIDIIIGTHKLIQSNIKFNQLGLLIIDEEHRFGVKQKEKLKALRAEVDILTLTATPIPRTLNMAMSGMRELSIIATPPAKRLSIKTFIHRKEKSIIREAILREIMRGGQVFYLHNKVDTIEKTTHDLVELIPEAKVHFAHGQMPEKQLEKVMSDFYHQRFNVLVCTTIIETGIDIPTANTIIIERADHFGLAQLHQLRGRVGRSHHQAYAYLLTPAEKLMTNDAKKRLQALSSLEDLGIGFTLATHDLEIRGCGELLGEEQSGHIHEIGFTLYMELLERAVESLKKGETLNVDEPLNKGTEVDLQISALIPDNYLPDVHTRLLLYKRIANAADSATLDELQVEMIDRFGLLPDAVKNLFTITLLKQQAQALGINKIEASKVGGRIDFNAKPNIDPLQLIKLIQMHPKKYQFDGKTRLRFNSELAETATRIEFVKGLMDKLTVAG